MQHAGGTSSCLRDKRMLFRAILVQFSLLLLFSAFMTVPSRGQLSGQATISGTITDSTGAAVPNVEIVVTNTETGVRVSRHSTTNGYFVISPLPPGTYTVTATAKGFQKLVQENVKVDALQVLGLALKLTVGRQTETVVVSDAPPLLQTADATLGAVLENSTYSELPVSMNTQQRDPTNFVYLLPGVTSGGRSGTFNGVGDGNMNEMYIEGVPLTTVDSQGDNRKINQAVSVDAVNQFQVQTNGSPATYQGAGVENFSIKSGTNAFHGSVNDFVRNTAFDSWGFFQKAATVKNAANQTVPAPKPPEHQNELSMSLSGPVIRNKIFFFANYDKFHYTGKASPGLMSLPSKLSQTGDFTEYSYPIYDPATLTACTTANKGVPCTTQFTALKNGVPTKNIIPASRLSPMAQYLQSFLPDNYSNSALTSNYFYPYLKGNDNWEFTGKVDINLGSRQQIALVSTSGVRKFLGLDMGATSVMPPPFTNGTIVTEPTTTAIIKHTLVISPTMINQVKYGYTRYWAPVSNQTYGVEQYEAGGPKVGIGNLPPGQASKTIPAITFSGGTQTPSSWSSPNGNDEAANSFTLGDDLQWNWKKHSFTFGFVTQWLQFNESTSKDGSQPINLTFKNTTTASYKNGTLQTTTGNAYASFLLGAVDSTSIYNASFSMLGSRFRTFSPYIQDDWKVNQRLTLNLGLRWDYYTPYTEAQNRWTFFNPNLTNPATGTPGALQYVGKGDSACNCRTPVNTYMKNVGPRFGFAYMLNDKTVIHGSAGIMYTHNGGVGGSSAGNYAGTGQVGLTVSPTFSDSGQGGIPAFYLNSNMGNMSIPSYSTAVTRDPTQHAGNYINSAGAGVTPSSLSYADPYLGGRAPYTGQWSFSVQRQINSNTTVSLNYTASSNHFLLSQGRGKWANQLDPKYEVLQDLLKKLPGSTDTTTGKTFLAEAQALWPGLALPYPNFGGAQGTIAAMLRPFPQYSSLTDTWGERGNSTYNALQVIIDRKESHDLSYGFNLNWSKNIDDMGASRSGYAIPGSVMDGGQTWSVPQRIDRGDNGGSPLGFRFYGVYGLPFGPGRLLEPHNRVISSLIREWKVAWISSASRGGYVSFTGTPVNSYVQTAVDSSTSTVGCQAQGVGTCYPSINPNFHRNIHINGNFGHGVTAANAGTIQFLDPNAFTSPGSNGYNIGNAPVTGAYGVRGLDSYDVDGSIKRTFGIWENVKFTFQADVFNADNHTQLGSLQTGVGSNTFGSLTKQSNSARDWQFAGKLVF